MYINCNSRRLKTWSRACPKKSEKLKVKKNQLTPKVLETIEWVIDFFAHIWW